MNSSDFNNNSLYFEAFLVAIGSTRTNDSIYIFIIIPLCTIGFILNMVNFGIIYKKDFQNITIFKYLKFYLLNSLVLNVLNLLNFLSFAPRYLDFNLSIGIASRIYRCKILKYVVTSFIYHRDILDCIIACERLANFMVETRMKEVIKYSPNMINILFLMYSFLVNAPTFFEFTIKTDSEIDQVLYSKDMDLIKAFKICGREEFFTTRPGQLILIILFILRELVTLIFQVIASILTLIYFRKYLNKRAEIVVIQEHDEEFRKKNIAEKKNEKKLTLMIFYFMSFSIICHAVTASLQMLLITINNQAILYSLLLINFMIFTIKNLTNFFFFYFFNNKFKQIVKLTLKNIFLK
jgi:hypothetical protein